MPYHCPDCREYFSVKTGTVMQSSKLPLRKWALGIHLMSTSLKCVSSMKLHRDLGITQKTALMMAQKIRRRAGSMVRPGQSAEASRSMKRTWAGKSATSTSRRNSTLDVARSGNRRSSARRRSEAARLSPNTSSTLTRPTLIGFVDENVETGSTVYSDDTAALSGLANMFNEFEHETVNHSVGEYVREMAHTNGIESFWSMLKRGHKAVYHKMTPKHLQRYVTEFSGRHNVRDLDTLEQMILLARGMDGRLLPWKKLAA